MMDFQIIAAIIFLVIRTIFVYLKRKSLDTKYAIPYILYFSMYKTKWGLKLMDSGAKRFRKPIVHIFSIFSLAAILFILGQKFLEAILAKSAIPQNLLKSHPAVFTAMFFAAAIIISFIALSFVKFDYRMSFVAFLGMILIGWELIFNIFLLFTKPEVSPGVGVVLPFKGKGIFYVPFFYWIISIFVIAVVHEFSHGLIARVNNLKVKSSGFAFLALIIPIIPAAFVEPDEKELKKRPHKEQLSVFAAGPLANIATAFLALAILSFIMAPLVDGFIEPNGVKVAEFVKENMTYPAENSGMKIGEIIQNIDNIPTPYSDNLSQILHSKKPGDIVMLKTDKSSYQIKLGKNPANESSAYIGAYLEQSTKIKDSVKASYGEFLPNAFIWIAGLFLILFILNLGIGLFNLVPIGPLDGGRMIQLPLQKYFGEEKGNRILIYISLFFLVIILANLSAGFGLFNFLK